MFSPAVGIFDRMASTDLKIGDVPVGKGVAINYLQPTNFYDNNIFEEANKFKPERWAEKNEETQHLLNLVMLGFSNGPRSCIGKNLALLESKVAVIKFLQRYKNLKEVNERGFTIDIAYHLKSGAVAFEKIK